ncbi:hypothetical protein REPUB_Repub17cG0195800 [Reevesia pubescens]
MSASYSSNFKFQDRELRKNLEFMDSSYYVQQNHQHNSGLTRYRSAPSSFLDNLVNGSVTAGATGFQDYHDIRSSTPEIETLFMLSCNGSANSDCHDTQEYGEKSVTVKQEESLSNISQLNRCSSGSSASDVMYQSLPLHSLENGNTVGIGNSVETSFGLSRSLGILEDSNSMQAKLGNGNSSNLVRQSSSPAEVFSNLCVDNGLRVIRKVSTFRACNGTNDETASTSKLYNNNNNNNHISFSSGPSSCSRPMPGIAEVENESLGVNGPENGSLGSTGNGRDGHFISNLRTDFWNNASFNGLKRARESDVDLFFGLSRSQTDQNRGSAALTHHLSLLKTSAEMAVVEKLWQFQGSAPCKIRAKRGCAIHPRSIAERVYIFII